MNRVKLWAKRGLMAVGAISIASYVFAQSFQFLTGNHVVRNGFLTIRDNYLRVGVGSTPGITPGADDLFVEGTLEVDGAVQLDGAVTINGAPVLKSETIIQNTATGNVDLSLRDYADTADDDMAHTLMRTNCTTATTGAEDCDFSISVPEAGAAVEARLTIDADGGVDIGGLTNDDVSLLPDVDVQIQNQTDANVQLQFHDYGSTADDDMAHAQFVVNCTDPNSASEDCDLDIQLALAGAAPASYLLLDADGDAIATKTEWQIRIQNGAAPEATCTVGELFIDTDETDDTNCTTTADNSLCLCTAADTWTALENN